MTINTASIVTSDGAPEATGARSIHPGHHLALIDPLHQILGLWLPGRHHPMLPRIPSSNVTMLAVQDALHMLFVLKNKTPLLVSCLSCLCFIASLYIYM